ncbi:alpha/beta hydrolase [Marinobacter fuscus]|uniref:Alpha/beta hydrolase n=1 Tax=Marinobacter fuscus TaxID=2109942 RepID=A0A2T1KEV3_9GAMM|nr:alpha/beta hydrolase [Marinobacter fuscus]PSF08293.1 alpha/beta hydrolase [Marinobacter fuscus]
MLRTSLNLTLLVTVALVLTACSKQGLYDSAIGWERSRAGLAPAQVSVGDFEIAYLHTEHPIKADTLVMIHGFGANKDNWTRLAREFKGEYNVYAIDLPGHGDSSKPLDIGYRLEDQVGYLHSIFQALELDRFHLMGNSMGGAITALYAAAHPKQVESAVLFDPAGILEHESELVDLVMDGDNPLIPEKEGDFRRLMDFALEQKPFVPWPIMDVMEAQSIANNAINQVIFADIQDSGFQPEFRQAITGIQAPVLVIWGKQDRVINYRNADLFVDLIPNARKVILEDIGHAPMIETPERSADLFRHFLQQN